MTDIKGVIFDLDGTLLDSMQMWRNVEENYLRSLGVTPPPDLSLIVRSLSSVEEAEYFRADLGVSLSVEEIVDGRNRMIEDFYFYEARLKEGVVPVLEALSKRGIKMCVATATERDLVEPAMLRCGIMKYFERIFTCDEEETSKTNPEIFYRAATFLGTEVSGTLVVEDALYAMKSAKKAGFQVAGVYDLSADDQQEEIKELCDYYWDTLNDMLAIL